MNCKVIGYQTGLAPCWMNCFRKQPGYGSVGETFDAVVDSRCAFSQEDFVGVEGGGGFLIYKNKPPSVARFPLNSLNSTL